MGVQKNKKSKARTRSRRSQWSKIESLPLVDCPQCHELRVPHRVCAACGFYKKSVVADQSVKAADKKETAEVKEKEAKEA